MCYAHSMELSASQRNTLSGDAPANGNRINGARRKNGWMAWIAARPITIVSSAVYIAALIMVLENYQRGQETWKGVLIAALLLLLVQDRLEYPLFGETPSIKAGVLLIATRFALTLPAVIILSLWENQIWLVLLALIPYLGCIFLGNRGGIAAGVVMWITGASIIVIELIPRLTKITTYRGSEIFTEYVFIWQFFQPYISLLTILTILIVFVVVSARITLLERAHTGRTKRLLAQLETAHARLGIYSQRAIAITDEHKRTARDIHDGLAHYLTAVSVQIDMAIAYRDISPEKTEGALKAAKEAISKCLQDVRRSVAILRSKREVVSLYTQDNELQNVEDAGPAHGRDRRGIGAWLMWLFPRPFDIIATTTYAGIFVLGWLEDDTAKTGSVLALAGIMLGLTVLDRLEYALFPTRRAWWLGVLLMAIRVAIMYQLFVGLGVWSVLLLIVIIPYWFTIYFGSRVGYVITALLAAVVGFLQLGIQVESVRLDTLGPALGAYLGTVLLLAFVLGVVAVTASTVVKESASRAVAERVLGDLRKTYADLAEFSRQAIEAGEARNSLARDIHDGLGHYLTAMSVQLEKAIAFRSIDPAAADQALNESRRLVAVALQEIRSTMGALREAEVELSPTKSLADLARHMGHGSLRVRLNVEGDESGYSRQALMTIYRAAQEGLTNVQKHAGAGQIDMNLEFGEDVARLEIRDNGKGFAQESSGVLTEQTGYGLQSMRERLELLGGELRIESEPGGGTTLYMSVPKRSTAQAGQLSAEKHVAVAAKSHA